MKLTCSGCLSGCYMCVPPPSSAAGGESRSMEAVYGVQLDQAAEILQRHHPIGQVKAIGRMEVVQALREVLKPPAQQEAADGGWRTMESAPKDGKPILIWPRDSEHATAEWDGKNWRIHCCRQSAGEITHWMPLPKPPIPQEAGR